MNLKTRFTFDDQWFTDLGFDPVVIDANQHFYRLAERIGTRSEPVVLEVEWIGLGQTYRAKLQSGLPGEDAILVTGGTSVKQRVNPFNKGLKTYVVPTYRGPGTYYVQQVNETGGLTGVEEQVRIFAPTISTKTALKTSPPHPYEAYMGEVMATINGSAYKASLIAVPGGYSLTIATTEGAIVLKSQTFLPNGNPQMWTRDGSPYTVRVRPVPRA